jgi:hypothetical protein
MSGPARIAADTQNFLPLSAAMQFSILKNIYLQ